MKKILLLFLALAAICSALACSPEEMSEVKDLSTGKPITAELEIELREAIYYFYEGSLPVYEKATLDYYLGEHNGCRVFSGKGELDPVEHEIKYTVAGYEFVYPDGRELIVSDDIGCYTLGKAYEMGLITSDDVGELHALWNERSR